ncbi:MAG: hypothetical protein A2Y25_03575 [Candidatus Melainabacteria bacterium GWF2_37_15]|nr:MAG: hypothetical protein A2Y25_03575 [Candidatus Melainabacteria bacterium GWF2_37_15]
MYNLHAIECAQYTKIKKKFLISRNCPEKFDFFLFYIHFLLNFIDIFTKIYKKKNRILIEFFAVSDNQKFLKNLILIYHNFDT